MDLLPDTQQDAVAEAASRVLADLGHPDRANEHAASGQASDGELWKLAVELGWLGLAVPERDGGAGCGLPEQVMLVRELGRSLAVGPFVGTMVAVGMAEGVLRDELLAGRPVASAFGLDSDGRLLVAEAPGADLVLRWWPDRAELLESPESGVPVAGIDPTLGLEVVDGDAARVVAEGSTSVTATATVLRSAGLVGIAEAVRDQAVHHALVREQFGRPIGSFQAIKHLCADMAVRAEAAWRQTCWAAVAVRDGRPDAARHVAAARLVAQAAALEGAAANIQVHGAMGFTAEHTAHLFLKRARSWSLLQRLDGPATLDGTGPDSPACVGQRRTSVSRPL